MFSETQIIDFAINIGLFVFGLVLAGIGYQSGK